MNRYSFEGGEPLITASVCACHEGGDAGEVCYRPGEIHDMGDNPDFAGGEPWVGPWMRREPDPDEPGPDEPPGNVQVTGQPGPVVADMDLPAGTLPAAAQPVKPAPGTEGA